MKASIILVSFALAACSSSSSGPAGCPNLAGNYTVTYERVSGTCDVSVDPKSTVSFSIIQDANGISVLIPSVKGSCPAQLDAASCRLTVTCDLTAADGSLVGTANGDYSLTSTGFSGTAVDGLRSPAVPSACQVTYRETATKL